MKIVVDENLPPALARALQAIFLQAIFVAEHDEIIYLRDRFGPRVTDLEWIETLSRESRWVIISGDRRITRNKAEYNAFRASTLIGFFLSAGLNKAKLTKKGRAPSGSVGRHRRTWCPDGGWRHVRAADEKQAHRATEVIPVRSAARRSARLPFACRCEAPATWRHRALAPVATPSTTFLFQPACPAM